MASPESTPATHTKNEQGSDGVGGFVPYGLMLNREIFENIETGVRYDPYLMQCPEHAADVDALEGSPRSAESL